MIQTYPDYTTYRQLYARFYHGRTTDQFLSLLGTLEGKRLLDLCGGDGRLGITALSQGVREVILVEEERQMIPEGIRLDPQIDVCIGTVQNWLQRLAEKQQYFDCVTCQQAVNYWLVDEYTAGLVASVVTPGGIFAFNTFSQEPPTIPLVKSYTWKDQAFVEVSWCVERRIHHVQIREGMPPHFTTFHWLPPDHFVRILEPFFILTVHQEGSTALYRCVRK